MTSLEKLAITGQALSRPTLRNRYRFWRHVEGFSIASAAFKAVVGLLRQGD
ncbi:MAG TPA: hypothetical protein VJ846_11495 [Sphingomicrobium sp.]|nr:hypothetical protein [Sphingomicrobium sp.]